MLSYLKARPGDFPAILTLTLQRGRTAWRVAGVAPGGPVKARPYGVLGISACSFHP